MDGRMTIANFVLKLLLQATMNQINLILTPMMRYGFAKIVLRLFYWRMTLKKF